MNGTTDHLIFIRGVEHDTSDVNSFKDRNFTCSDK